MPYISKIDHDGAQLSLSYRFSAVGGGRTDAHLVRWKVVPFDEIVANPSDLKHVVKLLGRSDGLGVVITTRSRHLCVFY